MGLALWIIVCTALLHSAVIHSEGTDKAVVEVAENASFRFVMRTVQRKSGDICSVKAPFRGDPYLLDPLLSGDHSDNRVTYTNDNSRSDCGMLVLSADVKLDTGDWIIYVTNTTGNFSEELTVRVVVQSSDVIPRTPVTIVEGESLYLRFEDQVVFNLIECRVNWTQRDVVLRPGGNVDSLVAYWGAGLSKDCGVNATRISTIDSGTWTLRALNTTGHVTEGKFEVTVRNESLPEETEKIFIVGGYEELQLGSSDTVYCHVQHPTGEWEELKTPSCTVNLEKVSKVAEGNWTAKYAVAGKVNEEQARVSVQIIARNYMHTSLKPSARQPGGLDLLCRWTTYEFVTNIATYCRFIRPDGVSLLLQDGLGNAEYSYNGDGINFSNSVKDCGVTIHSPRQKDVGTWQCVIGVSAENTLKGGFINVPSDIINDATTFNHSNYAIEVLKSENNIVVRNEDPLVLSCQATTSLNYCWFGHPNGSTLPVYSPTTAVSKTDLSAFTYSGRGLDLGDCSITISEASHKDEGSWSCNMGVSGKADLKVLIRVRVADGNIAADVPTVDYTDSDSAILKCHSIPKGVALEYCRFVRPDGVGFGFKSNRDVVMNRYRYYGEGLGRGICGVKIETVGDEDFGQWTCAALPVAQKAEGKAQNVEGKAHISFTDQRVLSGGAISGIVIGTIFAVAVVGVLAVYVYRRYKR